MCIRDSRCIADPVPPRGLPPRQTFNFNRCDPPTAQILGISSGHPCQPPTAVPYTHLDVYKRQPHRRCIADPVPPRGLPPRQTFNFNRCDPPTAQILGISSGHPCQPPTAVPYTHLDVYKRQPHRRCIADPVPPRGLPPRQTFNFNRCDPPTAQILGISSGHPCQPPTAVPYTHLDVYKRQLHSNAKTTSDMPDMLPYDHKLL